MDWTSFEEKLPDTNRGVWLRNEGERARHFGKWHNKPYHEYAFWQYDDEEPGKLAEMRDRAEYAEREVENWKEQLRIANQQYDYAIIDREDLRARIAELKPDAEIGRLVRRMKPYHSIWPAANGQWFLEDDARSGYWGGQTPQEALARIARPADDCQH